MPALSGMKIDPVILSITIAISLFLLIAAVLHLLIKLVMKIRSSQSNEDDDYPEMSNSGSFQRQLQHLFHLQDSGLDQASIDALPVFHYRDIVGLKEPFDCAVCLCEFTELDQLRLLPLCSHAFHISCIDTWLLANSTCPLCREAIIGLSFESPLFYYIERQKEIEGGSPGYAVKNSEEDSSSAISDKRVFSVRLGKLKNSEKSANRGDEIGETSSSTMDSRRCYSMGSFQYVVDGSDLQVALCPKSRDRDGRGQIGDFTREGDCEDSEENKISNVGGKGESFSVSKIWQWSKKGKYQDSSCADYSKSVGLCLP